MNQFVKFKELCHDMSWLQFRIGCICTLNRRINTWLQVLCEHHFATAKGPHHHLCRHHELPRPLQVWTSGLPGYHKFHRERWSPTSMSQRVLCLTWKLNFTDLPKKQLEKTARGTLLGILPDRKSFTFSHLPTSTWPPSPFFDTCIRATGGRWRCHRRSWSSNPRRFEYDFRGRKKSVKSASLSSNKS